MGDLSVLAATGLVDAAAWLPRVHHELALFAAVWLLVGMVDDLVVDLLWFRLLMRGEGRAARLPPAYATRPLRGPCAVMIPAWQEADVIAITLRHARAAWPQSALRLYVGCYRNDPGTLAAARAGAGSDPRIRIITLPVDGPTTKAGCLNRLYRAMLIDERRTGQLVRAIVLHDAEDMVHPAELAVFDAALDTADYVQLPVRAEPIAASRWVAGHYVDEFAEAHSKTMVVRDALGAALPAAGVGCAFARHVLAEQASAGTGPFAAECLTEDYELGWRVAQAGGRSRFLRLRDETGALVATRAVFPHTLAAAVRQKTRWTHGIAYQGWDRIGWWGRPVDRWMALRDRRAPLAAAVLVACYLSLLIGLVLYRGEPGAAGAGGISDAGLVALQWACLAGLGWRLALRFACTAREYGLVEGLRSLPRITVANLIAILAARQALTAYWRSLRGAPVRWDKTLHCWHPAQ